MAILSYREQLVSPRRVRPRTLMGLVIWLMTICAVAGLAWIAHSRADSFIYPLGGGKHLIATNFGSAVHFDILTSEAPPSADWIVLRAQPSRHHRTLGFGVSRTVVSSESGRALDGIPVREHLVTLAVAHWALALVVGSILQCAQLILLWVLDRRTRRVLGGAGT